MFRDNLFNHTETIGGGGSYRKFFWWNPRRTSSGRSIPVTATENHPDTRYLSCRGRATCPLPRASMALSEYGTLASSLGSPLSIVWFYPTPCHRETGVESTFLPTLIMAKAITAMLSALALLGVWPAQVAGTGGGRNERREACNHSPLDPFKNNVRDLHATDIVWCSAPRRTTFLVQQGSLQKRWT